jgi:hypothetical protein
MARIRARIGTRIRARIRFRWGAHGAHGVSTRLRRVSGASIGPERLSGRQERRDEIARPRFAGSATRARYATSSASLRYVASTTVPNWLSNLASTW